MERLFQEIPLRGRLHVDDHQFDGRDPAGAITRWWRERQGADLRKLSGTIQNDILKEYIARGTYIYPPRPAMRIITDIFAWAGREMPEWNTISISGYHIREAGSTAMQELAFTFANAIAYIEAAVAAGLAVDAFAPRLSFFFNSHSDFLEEIAKFRAARRIYARLMRDRFGAQDPRSHDAALPRADRRLHADRAAARREHRAHGARRPWRPCWAARNRCTPTRATKRWRCPPRNRRGIALRTQQIIAHETGVVNTADPVGGSECDRGADRFDRARRARTT